MPDDFEAKLNYILNDEKGKKLLSDIINYLTPLLSELSERRLLLPFASIFLTMVLGGEYAAERSIGNDPEDSYKTTMDNLEKICGHTREMLKANWETGELENLYQSLLAELSSSGESGSEQVPDSSERTQS